VLHIAYAIQPEDVTQKCEFHELNVSDLDVDIVEVSEKS
jgi:hypothetical protein